MARTKTTATQAPSTVRLIVRTADAFDRPQRYRAGLGPFGSEPVEVLATPDQVEAIQADPMLVIVEEQ